MTPNPAASRLRWSWMLFDWAAQPYFTLLATFIFPPFFVTQLASDPVQGQVAWGWTTAAAALATGLAAPWAGSLADRSGRIMPIFLASCALAVIGSAGLWWSLPGQEFAFPLAVACIVLSTIGFEVATSLNNSMLRTIASDGEASQLAWRGWALGGLSGILVLLVFVGLLMPGATGRTILGYAPLIDFHGAVGAVERFAGPFAAFWLALFLLPLVLCYRDRRPPILSVDRDRRPHPEAAHRRPCVRFLLANMLISDGLLALFAFGGIYGATVFGWDALRLGVFAIALTASGVLGVALCIPLDRWIGSEKIVFCSSAVVIGTVGFILGLDPANIFVWPAIPVNVWLLTNTAEVAFALAGLVVGAASASLQAALRSVYVVAVPAGHAGRWFGYFALSGKTTAFLGPLLVTAVIASSGSTKAGMSVILALILGGAALLRGSRPSKIEG